MGAEGQAVFQFLNYTHSSSPPPWLLFNWDTLFAFRFFFSLMKVSVFQSRCLPLAFRSWLLPARAREPLSTVTLSYFPYFSSHSVMKLFPNMDFLFQMLNLATFIFFTFLSFCFCHIGRSRRHYNDEYRINGPPCDVVCEGQWKSEFHVSFFFFFSVRVTEPSFSVQFS